MGFLLEEELTHSIIGAFYDVYNTLGYGLLEHAYALALEYELRNRGHSVGRQVAVRIFYKGFELTQQRLDMIVDERVIVEIKATHDLTRAAQRQLYSYLSATRLEVGLLLHFGPEARFYRLIKPNPDPPVRQTAASAQSESDSPDSPEKAG